MLVQAMGTHGKVAILTGVPGADNLEERTAVSRRALETTPYPGYRHRGYKRRYQPGRPGRCEDTMQGIRYQRLVFCRDVAFICRPGAPCPLWEDAALHRGMKTIAF